ICYFGGGTVENRHTPNPGYKPGEHWIECVVCGFDYYASDMKLRWDGVWVCKDDWEPRHPQDFVRAHADKIDADEPTFSTEPTFGEGVTLPPGFTPETIPPGTNNNEI